MGGVVNISISQSWKKLFKKNTQPGTISGDQIRRAAALGKRMSEQGALKDGQRVRLDYRSISEAPDYQKMNPAWVQFVEEHKDDVLTVCHDPECNMESVVCFEEDKREVKWWFWEGYLKVAK